MMGSDSSRRDAVKSWAMPSLFAIAGVVMACYPMLFSGLARMQNDAGDTRISNYAIEHNYLWLIRSPFHRDLWTPPVFYPEPNTAAFTEPLVGMVPFYAPWRALGLAPDSAFQIWMMVSLILNFAATYLLLRRCLRFGAAASCFGSFLFAFGSPRLNQLNHQFLLPHFFTVTAIFAICRLFQTSASDRNLRRGAVYVAIFCGSVVAQIYSCYYLGWFLGFALLLGGSFAIGIRSTRERMAWLLKTHWPALAVGAALSTIALSPLAAHYLAAARSVGFRQFWEAEGMLPRFQSWFYLGEENWLYGWIANRGSFSYLPMEWEQRLGLGLVTTAVVGWSLLRERRRAGVRILIGTWLAIALTASMYRWNFSPWKWIFHFVPGANGIRAVARIGLLSLIPAAIGLSFFIERCGEAKSRMFALALGLVCLLEQGRRSLSYDKGSVRAAVSALAARVDPRCEAFFCACDDARFAMDCQLDAIWAGLEVGLPSVNGVSGSNPPGFEALSENVLRSPADEALLKGALEKWLLAHGREPGRVCWVTAPASKLAGPGH
jgi:hypothetical protein